MRFLLVGVVMLAAVTAQAKALEFPKAFRGLWATKAATCAYLKRHRPRPKDIWLRVSARKVSGYVTNGKILRIVDSRTVEVEHDDGFKFPAVLTLEPDGTLDDRISGARASHIHVRCQ
jgi:hypothetical protein